MNKSWPNQQIEPMRGSAFRSALCLGIWLTLLIPLLIGCRGMGTQRFTAFAPSQAQELAAASRVVLDARCTHVTLRADYNLWENLHMLAPRPKRWKIDLTLQVERVVRGEFSEQSIQVHWLRDPTPEQSDVLGIAHRGGFSFTNGMPLRVGFDSYSGEQTGSSWVAIAPLSRSPSTRPTVAL